MIRRISLMASCVLLAVSVSAADIAKDNVLVFGGTGRSGIEIVRELHGAGASVTVFVRPTSDRAPLEPYNVSFVEGDALFAADVERAISSDSFTAIISAIGRQRGDVRPDYTANSNITTSALHNNVRRLIQISSVGTGNSRQHLLEVPDFMIEVLETKTKAENELIASGVNYTIIRPGGLLLGDPTGMAELTEDVSVVGGAINRSDLARLTVEVLSDDTTINKILHAHDPSLDSSSR
jgi:uncharacterized protein YbjT (DUF2867 family)